LRNPCLNHGPLLFCRYTDDCLIICDDCLIICLTQGEVDMCFNLLNELSVNIEFTRGKPIDGFHVGKHASGTKCTQANNKNTLFIAKTVSKVFSGLEKREALSVVRNIASSNGYPKYRSVSRSKKKAARFAQLCRGAACRKLEMPQPT
ncbi:hypothetical protein COOONC_02295, partial [Cooperia oncophora]